MTDSYESEVKIAAYLSFSRAQNDWKNAHKY